MSHSPARRLSGSRIQLSRRRILGSMAAGAAVAGAGTLFPLRRGWADVPVVYKHGHMEAMVVSDGHFVLPTPLLVAPDAPAAERQAALQAAGQSGDQFRLVNNVVVIRRQSEVILVDAGAGPRHQPTSGKLAENLKAAGIQPADVTTVVLTHGHPDHMWGILDASDNPVYSKASYVVSAREWDLWSDPNVLQRLPAVLPRERIVSGAQGRFARIRDKVRMVRGGDEIVSGIRVLETPGHTQGHISVELAGGDGLVIGGDALTNVIVSFQHPSWRVPVDHEADRGISTRLRLLDQLATDRRRLVGAHLPFPGTGFVERKDGAYRFVPA
jgi:glyoxylase-like metal-dependent hydrolase (beta-lactamase superfamily II)